MAVSPYKPVIPHDWLGLEKIIGDLWNIINVDTTLSAILTPPGSDGEVIYNDGGTSYGSDSTFTFNDGTKKLTCQVLDITTVAASVVDTDKFLVDDSNEVKFRTGAEVLSDIGASASGHLHDGATLQHDAVNSDGGAFSFTTTGAVTFNQSITAPNAILSGSTAIGLDMSGGTFSGASINLPTTPIIQQAGAHLIKFDDTNFNLLLGTGTGQGVPDEGAYNVFMGYQAGYNNDFVAADTGKYNIYVGYQAGYGVSGVNNTGYQNVAFGYRALYNNRSGYSNFAFGPFALTDNRTGVQNTAIGYSALGNIVSGSHCIGIGYTSGLGDVNTNGFAGNIYIGDYAGYGQTLGINNVNIGYASGFGAGSKSENVFIGFESGRLVTTGSSDVFIGYRSGYRQTTNSDLLIIDNQDRGSAALEITNALMYGAFNATPGSQTLRLNVGDLIQGNPVHSDADDGGAMVHSFIREDGAGTASTAATITVSHDGAAANDTDGKIVIATNLEGTGLVDALTISSSQSLTIANTIESPKFKMTAIGGFAILLTNKTGAVTVAGQLVKADTATDDAVILAAAGDVECFGVFLDSAIADAAEAWVVVSGIADVAFDDNVATTRGDWVSTGVLAGYAATATSPAAAPTHFEEIGHCIESVSAGGGGTHILARCVLHFN